MEDNKKITSSFIDVSFKKYRWFEHSLLTFFTITFFYGSVFFGAMIASRKDENMAESYWFWVISHAYIVLMIGVLLAIITNIWLFQQRKWDLIVSISLDSDNVHFKSKNYHTEVVKEVKIPYSDLEMIAYKSPRFLYTTSFSGYAFYSENILIGFLFKDHFTWSKEFAQLKLIREVLSVINGKSRKSNSQLL